jgi:hypothetical protein
MTIKATLFRPVAYAASLQANRQLRRFLGAHARCRAVQDELLGRLLAAHADTDFGRDHGFTSIRNYADFTAAVPVQTYADVAPYVRKVLAGETTALLPPGEPVLMFSMTSGTTGEPKHIPVTPRFLDDMRRGWNSFGVRLLSDHPTGYLRSILQITSPMDESRSPTNLPCGAISGLLAATQKSVVRRFYAAPAGVYRIGRAEDKYYTLLRCAAERDCAIITTANPSSTIRLIETGQAHAERLVRDLTEGTLTPPSGEKAPEPKGLKFRPNRRLARRVEAGLAADGELRGHHLWNLAVLANWTGGTLGLYLPRLRELFGDMPIRDIGLLASEGRFSIPLHDNTPAGVAEILGNFLEFIPAEAREEASPPVLRAEQLEIGQEYFLVVSNWTGLWRYDMDDRIRVVHRLGQSPVFEFLSRGRHTASITGEKLTEHQVVQAMHQAAQRAGTNVDRFVLQGRFAKTPYYQLRLDGAIGVPAEALAEEFDCALGRLNIEYQSKRESGRLGPIRPVVVAPGQMDEDEDELIRQRRGRCEQYKHQYLLREVLTDEADA